MKISKDVRDKIIELTSEQQSHNFEGWSTEDIAETYQDILLNGMKGYNEMTCDELLQEFADVFGFSDSSLSEEDFDKEALELFKEATAQVELDNLIASEERSIEQGQARWSETGSTRR